MTPPSDQPPSGPPPDDRAGAEDYPADYVPPESPVPPGYQPPPGYPPPGYPPPGQYHQPYGAPPPAKPPGRIAVGTAIVGTFLYFPINFLLALGAFTVGGSAGIEQGRLVFGSAALILALIAFGGGALLLTRKSRDAKGMGLGLMIGWAITSVVSAGFCTGLNPSLYSS